MQQKYIRNRIFMFISFGDSMATAKMTTMHAECTLASTRVLSSFVTSAIPDNVLS